MELEPSPHAHPAGHASRALPAGLAEALKGDFAPVRPLLPPAVRAAWAWSLAALAAAVLVAWAGVRHDRSSLTPVLLWFPALCRVVAGALLLTLALEEGVPGKNASLPTLWLGITAPPLLLVALAHWVETAAARLPAEMIQHAPARAGDLWICYPREVFAALPGLAVFAWLLSRAYPLRPVFAATLGALGVSLVADAGLHFTCPMTSASHTLLVHGGAIVTLAAYAAAAAALEARRPLRR